MAGDLNVLRHIHKAHLPRDPGRVERVAHNRGLNNNPHTTLSSLLLIKEFSFFHGFIKILCAQHFVDTDQNARKLFLRPLPFSFT